MVASIPILDARSKGYSALQIYLKSDSSEVISEDSLPTLQKFSRLISATEDNVEKLSDISARILLYHLKFFIHSNSFLLSLRLFLIIFMHAIEVTTPIFVVENDR